MALHGVGVETAATLLVAAGDNPERLRSESAWAHLCGVAPIEASSGKSPDTDSTEAATVTPTRPSGGSRSPGCAATPETRAYVERRTAEGKSKREIIRILKRYIAREVCHHLRPTTH